MSQTQYQSFVEPLIRETPSLSWGPEYPDFARRVDRVDTLVAEQQASFTPRFLPLSDVRWQSHYPDTIDRIVYPTANQQASFTPRYLPIADLRWRGTYPDWHVPAPYPLRPSVVRSLFPIVAPPAFTFLPDHQYPDWLSPTESRTEAQQAAFTPTFLPLSDLRWQATYIDRIDRLEVRAVDQQPTFTPEYLPLFDLRWQARYPDRLDRLEVLASRQWAAFTPQYLPVNDLRWSPVYPDQIPRFVVDAAVQPVLAEPRFLPLADLRWAGTFPDQVWPLAGLETALQLHGALDPFPRPVVIEDLRWLAQYPSTIDRDVYLTANQAAWWSVSSTLIWTGPINPCPPATTGGEASVIIGRGW